MVGRGKLITYLSAAVCFEAGCWLTGRWMRRARLSRVVLKKEVWVGRSGIGREAGFKYCSPVVSNGPWWNILLIQDPRFAVFERRIGQTISSGGDRVRMGAGVEVAIWSESGLQRFLLDALMPNTNEHGHGDNSDLVLIVEEVAKLTSVKRESGAGSDLECSTGIWQESVVQKITVATTKRKQIHKLS